jgi:methylamine dehydrogenase accessory protein MauD
MISLSIASQVFLWIGFGVLAVLVAALARQVGVLHERIAPAGALTLHQKVNVGDIAPAMTLPTLSGGTVIVGGDRGKRSQLIFFLSPDCPLCKSMLPVVRSSSLAERDWLDVLLASDGVEGAHAKMIADERLQAFDYVLSESLGRSLGVAKLPYAVLIDQNGRIASMGLINTREHLESLFEAKERGVTSIQQYLAQR